MESSFAQFECGCIGLIIDGPERQCWVVRPCDDRTVHHYEPIQIWDRTASLGEKKYKPVPTNKLIEILEEIGDLTDDGYRFRRIQTELGLNRDD